MPDADRMLLRFGSRVTGLDGRLGKLADAVVEPSTLKVTHVIVKPSRLSRSLGGPRLAPFELVRPGRGREALTLDCTLAAFRTLFEVEEAAYVPLGEAISGDEEWDVGITDAVTPIGDSSEELGGWQYPAGYACFTYDLIPRGEAEVRRMSVVMSKDGVGLGGVAGLITYEDGGVKDVLLSRRRMWRKLQLAIPVSAVTSIETDEIRTALTRHQAEHLRERTN